MVRLVDYKCNFFIKLTPGLHCRNVETLRVNEDYRHILDKCFPSLTPSSNFVHSLEEKEV